MLAELKEVGTAYREALHGVMESHASKAIGSHHKDCLFCERIQKSLSDGDFLEDKWNELVANLLTERQVLTDEIKECHRKLREYENTSKVLEVERSKAIQQHGPEGQDFYKHSLRSLQKIIASSFSMIEEGAARHGESIL